MATPQGEDKLESDVHLQRLEDYVLVESMDKVITMIIARFLLHEYHTHPLVLKFQFQVQILRVQFQDLKLRIEQQVCCMSVSKARAVELWGGGGGGGGG